MSAVDRAIKRKMRMANDRYERAAEALVKSAEICYPIGSVVEVTLGIARIRGRVVAHGTSWYDPDSVQIENVLTGKRRRFSATCDSYRPEFISAPERKALAP
jgi:hypothetical protein